MKCPYCGKSTKDIPEHLEKSLLCYKKHIEKLQCELTYIVKQHYLENKDKKGIW